MYLYIKNEHWGKEERSCTTAEGATVVSNEKNEKESISNISQ